MRGRQRPPQTPAEDRQLHVLTQNLVVNGLATGMCSPTESEAIPWQRIMAFRSPSVRSQERAVFANTVSKLPIVGRRLRGFMAWSKQARTYSTCMRACMRTYIIILRSVPYQITI